MISYRPLFITLAKKGLIREDLRIGANLPRGTITKLGKNKHISTTTLDKICAFLNVPVEEVIQYVPDAITSDDIKKGR